MNTYSIGEVAKMLDISISTLRYYDKEGLLNSVERTAGGIRIFKDKDINQLNMVECLKNTGMQLKDIRTFFEWCEEGDSTIPQRYQMFLNRRKDIEKQIEVLQNSLDLVNYKCEYYALAAKEGTVNTPKLQFLKNRAVKSSDYVKHVVGEN
ncbi:MAG: MerR family transcriptional regulator [Lachnospiraceae bacterium]|nr:MerR family transcriptional regulator [Lachnospiraceae bacterium]MDD3615228.1 MerR family transcriptional regulator [Lachnospiraceae bacterium]